MDDDETFAIDKPHGHHALFAIVAPVVAAGQHGAFKDQGGMENIDPSFSEDGPALLLIPFEVHAEHVRVYT